MRTAFGYLISEVRGRCPTNAVGNYLTNVRIIERLAALVTRLEIEYLSRSAKEASAAAEYISVLIPAAEHERIGLRNIEGLAVKLLLFNEEMIGDSLRYGMLRHQIPHDLLLISSPREISVSSDDSLEGL